jgi:hypothetical protein
MEDDQPAGEGEVSQTFVIGLIVAGVLLFGLFVWYTVVSGGATPL